MSLAALKSDMLDMVDDAVMIGRFIDGTTQAVVAYTNAAFVSLSGHQSEDLAGTCFTSHLQDALGIDLEVDVILATYSPEERVQRDVRLVMPDGTKTEFNVSIAFKGNVSDDARYICVTLRRLTVQSATATLAAAGPDTSHEDLVRERDAAVQAHQRLVAALEAYPDPFVIYDKDLRLVSWNSAYETSMTDGTCKLKSGTSLRAVLEIAVANGRYPIAEGRGDEWINGIISQDVPTRIMQDVELENDIHHRLFRCRSEVGDYVVIRLNSTELVQQKRAAEGAEERLLAALNAYPFPFVIYDADDCIVVWNDAYAQSMSSAVEPIEVGMHRNEVAHVALRAGKLKKVVDQDVQKPVQDLELPGDIHHRLLRTRVSNGDLVIVRLDTTELVRQRRAVEAYARDLEQANQEISHLAFHDDLTGLGNRRQLKRKFEEFEARRKRDGGEIAALHIDLDRFKQINDAMGHAAGDQVLLDVSDRISSRLDSKDIAARIGGDEFVVLTYVGGKSKHPEILAEELLTDLSKPTFFEGKECRFGASIGIAITPLTSVDELLTNSDVALYKAKGSGRGQMSIFDSRDLEEMRVHKALADEVLRGIEKCEFVPFFQPQVDAVSHEVVGLEVLARWEHPVKGILPPANFLSVAADLNVSADIDKMVFERAITACTQAFGSMKDVPDLAFNVSASRIADHDVGNIQHYSGAYPGGVTFELLETIFMEEEHTEFFWKLDQFRDLGIGIEVDDFGSGRASIVALQRINPDRIKIDRRLVDPIDRSDPALRLLRSIVEIGHALEMGVIAEGVETLRQAELLTELGCDRLQGYYFSRPVALPRVLEYLGLGNAVKIARNAHR